MSCVQTSSAAAPCARHHTSSRAAVGDPLGRLARKLALWFTRYQTRRVLRELDAHRLRDIGVTPEQARREAAKPCWIE